MWKCSNCGEICNGAFCDRCGLPKEESVFDDFEFSEKELEGKKGVSQEDIDELIEKALPSEADEEEAFDIDSLIADILPEEDGDGEIADLDIDELIADGFDLDALIEGALGTEKPEDDEQEDSDFDELTEGALKPETDEEFSEDDLSVEYIEDAYIEPEELAESKRAKSKKEIKADEKREKRVADLEEKLKKERASQYQLPSGVKYEVKLKKLKRISIIVVASVVAVCALLSFVLIRKYSSENAEMKKMINTQNVTISNLEGELEDVGGQKAELEDEIGVLRKLNEAVRVIDSNGIYHMYGCEEVADGVIWIYEKEQVVDNPRYEKCIKCN